MLVVMLVIMLVVTMVVVMLVMMVIAVIICNTSPLTQTNPASALPLLALTSHVRKEKKSLRFSAIITGAS